jgi:hypothetical protein
MQVHVTVDVTVDVFPLEIADTRKILGPKQDEAERSLSYQISHQLLISRLRVGVHR